ncbi:MAG: DNA sulfur modification protein DndB [Acidobacteria bacterium]|nr:DNA sulfur modification protein DndB [Acidobacteriota bacterium]
MKTGSSFTYTFAALRGVQAGTDYYVAMCPLRLIPKLFLFDEEELPAELRAQRPLNRTRIPAIARYMLDNPKAYVFSSIAASVDGDVRFEEALPDLGMGSLVISMTAKFIINDGQHRRAAIEAALSENPELGDETISVVLFIDGGLKRSQQMFADLNQYAIRPNKTIGILYDVRSPLAQLARSLVEDVKMFKSLTELERSSISNRSIKLFTLSSIYQGTKSLLGKRRFDDITIEDRKLATAFWTAIAEQIPEWKLAAQKKVTPSELRREFVHSHGIALHSLGLMGSTLIAAHPKTWTSLLKKLSSVDWSRRNTQLWEGRALSAGRISKANTNVQLTAAFLKQSLNLKLSEEEIKLEKEAKKRTL